MKSLLDPPARAVEADLVSHPASNTVDASITPGSEITKEPSTEQRTRETLKATCACADSCIAAAARTSGSYLPDLRPELLPQPGLVLARHRLLLLRHGFLLCLDQDSGTGASGSRGDSNAGAESFGHQPIGIGNDAVATTTACA